MNIASGYIPHAQQKAFHSSDSLYTLFGGAKAGGKTRALVHEVEALSLEFPGNYGFLGRKRAVDFRTTTFETFKRYIPSELYTIKEQKKEIHWVNGSVTLYGGLDNTEDIVKFNSMELGYFAVDQAEEISRHDFAVLVGALNRFTLADGRRPRYRGVMSCNPAPCWLKEDFILNPKPDYRFIQSLPTDNPHNPSNYYEQLKEVWKFNPAISNAYLHGSWDDIEGDNLLIPHKAIQDAVDKPLPKSQTDFTIVACDPARFGNDETAIYVIRNNAVIHYKIVPYSDGMVTAGWCMQMKQEFKADMIIIDDNGLGAGPADRLIELKQPVYCMNSAEKSDLKQYKNMRYELWWSAQEMFIGGDVSIPNDPVLIGQLASLRYRMTSTGELELETKKQMKARHDKSPDRAEALIMGLWGMKNLSGMAVSWEQDEYQQSIRKPRNGRGGY